MLGQVYRKEKDWVASLFWEGCLHALKVTSKWKFEEVTALNEEEQGVPGSRGSLGVFSNEF